MSTLAERQLAAWQDIASTWPVNDWKDSEEGQIVGRCGECDKGIMLTTDSEGHYYKYTGEQWMALIVLHLRNHHPDLDPDR